MVGEYYLINVGSEEEPCRIPAKEEVSLKPGTRQFMFQHPTPTEDGSGSINIHVLRLNVPDGDHVTKIVQKREKR